MTIKFSKSPFTNIHYVGDDIKVRGFQTYKIVRTKGWKHQKLFMAKSMSVSIWTEKCLIKIINAELSLHVREEPPGLVSSLRVVDERGAVRHWSSPGDGHRLPSVVSQGEDGVEVETELGEGEEEHHQGGRTAGELLHVSEHPSHALQSRLLLRAQSVVLYHL